LASERMFTTLLSLTVADYSIGLVGLSLWPRLEQMPIVLGAKKFMIS